MYNTHGNYTSHQQLKGKLKELFAVSLPQLRSTVLAYTKKHIHTYGLAASVTYFNIHYETIRKGV